MSLYANFQMVEKQLPSQVKLVAVSKTKPNEMIVELYEKGVRVFGENRVQELVEKQAALPQDIEWHMIGHLQANKVKYIAPFVSLIHAIDKPKLAKEINKQAAKNGRVIEGLIQVHIAQEQAKYGFTEQEIERFVEEKYCFEEYPNLKIVGLMGMATFTDNQAQIKQEFETLKQLFDKYQKVSPNIKILSMGMSGDYPLAIACGSNMVRVGSSIFGARN